jgi:hypothetical protein
MPAFKFFNEMFKVGYIVSLCCSSINEPCNFSSSVHGVKESEIFSSYNKDILSEVDTFSDK